MLLVFEAAIVHAVGVVKEVLRFVFLLLVVGN